MSFVFSDDDLSSVLRSVIEEMSINPEVDVKVVVAMDTRLVMVHRVQSIVVLKLLLLYIHKPISGNKNSYFIPYLRQDKNELARNVEWAKFPKVRNSKDDSNADSPNLESTVLQLSSAIAMLFKQLDFFQS